MDLGGPAGPVRILRVMTRLNIGGPAIHAMLLSTRLDPQRFRTWLVVGRPEVSEGDLTGLVRSAHVDVMQLDTLRRPIRPWADAVTLVRLLRVAWRVRPQIIHTHMAKAGALGRMAGLLYNSVGPGRQAGQRASLVHTFHGHVLERYFSLRASRFFLAIERWLARRTQCLIAVSAAVRDDLLSKGIGQPSRWRIIPLGVELTALAQLPLPNGGSTARIGLVGRLVAIKNPALFVSAIGRLIEESPGRPVCGVIVGDGPLRRGLEADVKRLGLEGRIAFLGWQRELPQVYGQLEISCLTSWNEGTPVALIEAMAAGRAVVATAVGGVRDVLGTAEAAAPPIPRGSFQLTQRGVLVQPGDVVGFASALRCLIQDAPLRRQLGLAARTYVTERFAAERLCRDIAALYEECSQGEEP